MVEKLAELSTALPDWNQPLHDRPDPIQSSRNRPELNPGDLSDLRDRNALAVLRIKLRGHQQSQSSNSSRVLAIQDPRVLQQAAQQARDGPGADRALGEPQVQVLGRREIFRFGREPLEAAVAVLERLGAGLRRRGHQFEGQGALDGFSGY